MRTQTEVDKEIERLRENSRTFEQDIRLEMLQYVKTLYSEECLDFAAQEKIFLLIGKYLTSKDECTPLGETWRNLNTRIWTLKWIMKTEE